MIGARFSLEYSTAMKSSAIVIAFLAGLLVNCHPAQAQCPPILTTAQGTISGEVQDGDVLFLRFVYSRKRVESSSPQTSQRKQFTVSGAYSTFTRVSPQGGHICRSAPRLIQLVFRDRNGETLDTVDLKTPDPASGVIEVSYGKRQTIVLHRPPVSAP